MLRLRTKFRDKKNHFVWPPNFASEGEIMYGVIEVAGHQYRVKAGDIIDVEKLSGNEGDVVEFATL